MKLSSNGNGNDGCVSVPYNSLFISGRCLQKVTKQQYSHILDIRENVNSNFDVLLT